MRTFDFSARQRPFQVEHYVLLLFVWPLFCHIYNLSCFDKEDVSVSNESAYPKILNAEGRPISYEYSSILEDLQPGLDHQTWLLASMVGFRNFSLLHDRVKSSYEGVKPALYQRNIA